MFRLYHNTQYIFWHFKMSFETQSSISGWFICHDTTRGCLMKLKLLNSFMLHRTYIQLFIYTQTCSVFWICLSVHVNSSNKMVTTVRSASSHCDCVWTLSINDVNMESTSPRLAICGVQNFDLRYCGGDEALQRCGHNSLSFSLSQANLCSVPSF